MQSMVRSEGPTPTKLDCLILFPLSGVKFSVFRSQEKVTTVFLFIKASVTFWFVLDTMENGLSLV